MVKVKELRGYLGKFTLEEAVNNFLQENSIDEDKLIDIKYTNTGFGSVNSVEWDSIALVIYKV